MPTTNKIFYETQRNGLCRMHALNAYFGKSLINEEQFSNYMNEFDAYVKDKYKDNTSCKNFDLVNSDQNNIISYILKKYGVYTRYIPLNGIKGKKFPLKDLKGNFAFIYNDKHIWGVKKNNGAWWNVDSMKGVRKTNIYRITRTKNIGFMIPVDMKTELYKHVNEIKKLLEDKSIKTKKDIVAYLKELNEQKQILGDLEIHIGISIDLIEARIQHSTKSQKFEPIYTLVKKYDVFLLDFIEKKYSLESLIIHIPDIISHLLKICFQIHL